MRLFLVRHAQTSWNAEGRAQGHTNIPLDETGELQALALSKALARTGIRKILSSDLKRSADTALPLGTQLQLETELRTDLRERSFGDWEGLGFEELRRRKAEIAWYEKVELEAVVPPGGESIDMVWKRLLPVSEMLQNTKESTLVVTHGGTCALLLAQLVRGTTFTARSFRFANTGLTEISRKPDGNNVLIRYNDILHLNGLAALSGGLEGSHRKA